VAAPYTGSFKFVVAAFLELTAQLLLSPTTPRHLWVLTLLEPLPTLRLTPKTASAGSGKAFPFLAASANGVLVLDGMNLKYGKSWSSRSG